METVEVRRLNEGPFVERWMTLVKVKAAMDVRPIILQTAELFRSRVVDVGDDSLVFESTGDHGKIEAFLEAVKPFGVLEVASSGAVAMERAGFLTGTRIAHIHHPSGTEGSDRACRASITTVTRTSKNSQEKW